MLSVREIAARVAAGQSTAAAELAACERLIAAREPALKAFACRPDAIEPGHGPLSGVACGVKDIIDTADLPTQMGSPIYAGWQPRADAPIVMALKAAGASVAGKTHTTAFAFLDPAPTHNPHDPTASPGGSSAGSAAAVAAGVLPLALGTQTGGSIVRPASYCGIAGIKPSFGLLSTVGVKTYSWTLDTLGLMAATADDLGFALAAIGGRPELDVSAAELRGLRIGISRQAFAGEAEPASLAALQLVRERATAAGAGIVDIAEPAELAAAFEAHGTIQGYEVTQALAWEYRNHRRDLPPILGGYLDAARGVTAPQYDDARRTTHHGRRAAHDYFAQVDAVVTIAAPGEAPDTMASTGDSKFNRLWTLLGTPCLTIPVSRGGRNLPVGIQVICRFGADEQVIAVAKALEKLFRRD